MLREKIKLLGAFSCEKSAQTFSLHFVQGNYQVLIHYSFSFVEQNVYICSSLFRACCGQADVAHKVHRNLHKTSSLREYALNNEL